MVPMLKILILQISDIDVAVVGDNFTGDPVEDILTHMRMRRKIDYRIEPRPFL